MNFARNLLFLRWHTELAAVFARGNTFIIFEYTREGNVIVKPALS